MTKETPARIAPTHQTIIKNCKFDFAITHLPSHADLRQTPSGISKSYRIWNTDHIPGSQSHHTFEMRRTQHDHRRAFLSADEASDTLLNWAFFTISIWYRNIPNRKCRR
jgi:hypothetical protein